MEKKYLVVGTWSDKVSGMPVSRIAEINSGINKNGQPYEIANTDSRETVDGSYPVGTILTATMNLTVQAQPENQRSLKIATSK